MLAATFVGTLIVPVFYVAIQRLVDRLGNRRRRREQDAADREQRAAS
jgi:hypothetical protein